MSPIDVAIGTVDHGDTGLEGICNGGGWVAVGIDIGVEVEDEEWVGMGNIVKSCRACSVRSGGWR